MIKGVGDTEDSIDRKVILTTNPHDTSLMQASTDFPSDIMTSRIIQQHGLPKLIKDSTQNLNLDLTSAVANGNTLDPSTTLI